MNSQHVMVLQWTFLPPDYFEAPVVISRDDYTVSIQDGKIDVRMAPALYETNPNIKDAIEDALNHRFRAMELISHHGYSLSYAGRLHIHPDGHKEFFLTINERLTVRDSVDFTASDKAGNVIFDSRKERLQQKMMLADLVERHSSRDSLVKSMLKSYHAAVTDPDNELVYLYEIRDALAREFRGENQVRAILNISSASWHELGRIANDAPLKQGRHRGKFVEALRDATEEELGTARQIARDLIFEYLRYLEENHTLS